MSSPEGDQGNESVLIVDTQINENNVVCVTTTEGNEKLKVQDDSLLDKLESFQNYSLSQTFTLHQSFQAILSDIKQQEMLAVCQDLAESPAKYQTNPIEPASPAHTDNMDPIKEQTIAMKSEINDSSGIIAARPFNDNATCGRKGTSQSVLVQLGRHPQSQVELQSYYKTGLPQNDSSAHSVTRKRRAAPAHPNINESEFSNDITHPNHSSQQSDRAFSSDGCLNLSKPKTVESVQTNRLSKKPISVLEAVVKLGSLGDSSPLSTPIQTSVMVPQTKYHGILLPTQHRIVDATKVNHSFPSWHPASKAVCNSLTSQNNINQINQHSKPISQDQNMKILEVHSLTASTSVPTPPQPTSKLVTDTVTIQPEHARVVHNRFDDHIDTTSQNSLPRLNPKSQSKSSDLGNESASKPQYPNLYPLSESTSRMENHIKRSMISPIQGFSSDTTSDFRSSLKHSRLSSSPNHTIPKNSGILAESTPENHHHKTRNTLSPNTFSGMSGRISPFSDQYYFNPQVHQHRQTSPTNFHQHVQQTSPSGYIGMQQLHHPSPRGMDMYGQNPYQPFCNSMYTNHYMDSMNQQGYMFPPNMYPQYNGYHAVHNQQLPPPFSIPTFSGQVASHQNSQVQPDAITNHGKLAPHHSQSLASSQESKNQQLSESFGFPVADTLKTHGKIKIETNIESDVNQHCQSSDEIDIKPEAPSSDSFPAVSPQEPPLVPGQARDERGKRKGRINYSHKQLQSMDRVFQSNPYPKTELLEEVSVNLDIPVSKIKVWFQNKRARARRRGSDKTIPEDKINQVYTNLMSYRQPLLPPGIGNSSFMPMGGMDINPLQYGGTSHSLIPSGGRNDKISDSSMHPGTTNSSINGAPSSDRIVSGTVSGDSCITSNPKASHSNDKIPQNSYTHPNFSMHPSVPTGLAMRGIPPNFIPVNAPTFPGPFANPRFSNMLPALSHYPLSQPLDSNSNGKNTN